MSVVLGVDGASVGSTRGWVSARLEDGALRAIEFHADLAGVLAAAPDVEVVAIDIPLGHDDPEGARNGGRRACDLAAKAWLGPRHASVFLAPPPVLLDRASHGEARRLARERGLAAPSAQAWSLRDRMQEAERAGDARLREVHPEVAFQRMLRERGPGQHLGHAKTTWNGLHERLGLLRDAGLRPSRSLGGVGKVGPDDVLDATIAAWSAQRLAEGRAVALPEDPPKDPATGRAVAIWA